MTIRKASIIQMISTLRTTFKTGKTKSLSWRQGQLIALKKLLDEQANALESALKHDLGKHPIESQITEIAFVQGEIKYALRRLKKWMKAKYRFMPLTLQPAIGKLIHEPLGLVLIIAPWNYPLQLSLLPLVGAIAAGNVALLKPSEVSLTVSNKLAELIPQYLDPEAIGVIEGGAETTSMILEEPFDHIFYTGNEHVARIISNAAAKHLTPVTLELGGKSPVWVSDSTDLKKAAQRLAWGKFLNAGQTCVAPDYILATSSTAKQLGKHLISALKNLYGDQPEKSPSYGRIISEHHLQRLKQLLASVTTSQIIVGAEINDQNRYIAPTIIDEISLDAPLMQTEIFGPILPIVRVENFDEAIQIINERPKPLALYAFTNIEKEKQRLIQETSSGALGFNLPVAHLSARNLPFGGIGTSGQGSYHGYFSFTTFSHLKPILSKSLWPDTMWFIYAPYGYISRLITKLLIKN
jgi:aldehyde dehydrogenase